MKTEAKIFLFLIAFFVVVTPAYAVITWQMGHFEVIGTTVLALTLLFCLMVWGLLIVTGRTVGMRPEDRKDGEIVENAGALGFFPPSSIVPFWSALAIMVILLGVVYGWWLSLVGVALGIWGACGWAYEFYTGDYKH